MLCLLVDGTMQEISASEIERIANDGSFTHLFLKDCRTIIVDETEENLRKVINSELFRINTSEPLIRLHLYYSNTKSGYYPICIPVSAIKSVARSYYSYDMNFTGKLASQLPKDAREKDTDRRQPTLISLNYPVKDSRGDMVEQMTVYESVEYVMSFIKTVN